MQLLVQPVESIHLTRTVPALTGSTCYGRNWNDTVPFRDFLNEELHGLDPSDYYTQKQLYELFDPFNERLPYMFDDYEWRHCKDDDASQESQ